MKRVYAVILAAGAGERAAGQLPKQLEELAGRPLVAHTIERFQRSAAVDEIIVVIPADGRAAFEALIARDRLDKVTRLVYGGARRLESSAAGVRAIDDDDAKVLIHDGVRPFVSQVLIEACVAALDAHACVDIAVDVVDTIIRVDAARLVAEVPDKRYLKRGQTPQGFHLPLLREAQRRALDERAVVFSDDCGPVLHYGLASIYVVPGETDNFKITYPADLERARALLRRSRATPC